MTKDPECPKPGGIIRDLGDGLILRWSKGGDADALCAFNGSLFKPTEQEEPSQWVLDWTRSMVAAPHPTIQEGDATIVEDTRAGKIVSSMCLIPQTWACDGIEFGVGRPELVGTHEDYRRRGLIRAQFEAFHEWSARRGHAIQAITGIGFFYRQFGYELAMDLGGNRQSYAANVPQLAKDKDEPFRIRPASEADIPFMSERHDAIGNRALWMCARNDAIWQHELRRSAEPDTNRHCILEDKNGARQGCFIYSALHHGAVRIWFLELVPGCSYREAAPSILRHVWALGETALKAQRELEAQREKKSDAKFDFVGWELGVAHPVYEVCADLMPKTRPPYAWYIRIADLCGFLRRLTPVLERRLAESPLAGHTGPFKINAYTWGIQLDFEQGRLARVEPFQPRQEDEEKDHVRFPYLTFLQAVMGRRTADEIGQIYADCGPSDETRALCNVLLTRKPSFVLPVA